MTPEQSTVRIIDTITLSDNWYILKNMSLIICAATAPASVWSGKFMTVVTAR